MSLKVGDWIQCTAPRCSKHEIGIIYRILNDPYTEIAVTLIKDNSSETFDPEWVRKLSKEEIEKAKEYCDIKALAMVDE